MTRGILNAGNESALASAVAAEAAKRVEQFAAALIPGRADLPVPQAAVTDGRIPLTWNPAGSISARTLVLQAESRMGRIDDAILVCAPPALRCRPGDIPPAEVETLLEENVKGWYFLVRELALFFGAKKAGTLSLVFSEYGSGGGKDESADLFGVSAAAAFKALAQGLLSTAAAESWQTLGFSAAETGEDAAFAAFVFKRLDEAGKRDNGKLFRYGKLNLFGR